MEMPLAVPMINDALRTSGHSGADFLRDFESIFDETASWSTERSSLPGWSARRMMATRSGRLITASVRLSETTVVTMDGGGGSLVVHGLIPNTLHDHLVGRHLSTILEHPLIARSGYIMASVARQAVARRWRFGFPISPEALIR